MGVGDGEGGLGGLTEDQLATLDTSLERAIEVEKKFKDIATAVDDYSEALRRGYNIQEKSIQELEKRIEKATDLTQIQEQINIAENLSEQTLGRINKILEDTSLTSEEARKKILKSLQEEKAQFDLITKASKEADGFVGGIAGKLGIANKFSDTAVGKFAEMSKMLQQSGEGSEILQASLARTLSPANLAASLLSKMAESVVAVALALDVANSKFQRTTGFAGDFKEVMGDISSAGLLSGVSIEDAGAAMGSLSSNFSAFNPAATETNARLGETAALLQKTGVSADVSAGTMDFFTRAMGMSATASADLTRELALAGTGIGITTNKMLSDFQKLNGYLIGFGDQSTTVFKNLQAQAKATGISIDSLVGIAKKFDAFDTAAQSAGQLNAVLGTNLSTIDMLNATTDQRLSMLAQEIQMSTGGFKNLDRYTQMYVAQSIGAKDAAEAERLLNIARNPAELAKYNSEMQASAMRQDQLADLTAQMVPIMEQFKIAVFGLGLALMPVVNLITGLAKGVTSVIQGTFKLNEMMNGSLIPVLGLLSLAIVGVKISTMGLTIATKGLVSGTGLGALLLISGILMHMFPEFADQFAILTIGVFAFGLASKFATGKIGMIVSVLATLYALLASRINPVFAAVFGFMALGVIALGKAFNTIKGQAVIGGLVIALVAASVALMVYAVADLMGLLINNLSILPEFALKLIVLGYAFGVFGAGVLIGATALGMALPMLVMAAPVLGLIAVAAMGIGIGFDMMGDGLIKMGSGLAAVVAGLSVVESLTSDDGFFAITTDGGKTSMVSAKGGTLTNFSSENITVDVKIPEIKVPAPIVHVYIDGKEIRKLVRRELANVGGG
tara:strand:+ start:363 stop:2900 length:2538 start_codon:yes stop_codon:yes gene_type:complete